MKYLMYDEERKLKEELKQSKRESKEDGKLLFKMLLCILAISGIAWISECKADLHQEEIRRGIFGDCWVCKCGNEVYVDFNTCPVCGRRRGS